jgi:hypothetical protein
LQCGFINDGRLANYITGGGDDMKTRKYAAFLCWGNKDRGYRDAQNGKVRINMPNPSSQKELDDQAAYRNGVHEWNRDQVRLTMKRIRKRTELARVEM